MTMLLLDELTERELDVLRLMVDGYSNREIADNLVLSFETVRWYTKQIYSKLGVHSRAQAILTTQNLGLLEPDAQHTKKSPAISNLPAYASSFVGRNEELKELVDLLQSPDVRLATIAGPGGMGKTRLAVEAARLCSDSFPDGLYLIPCASLTSPDEILPAIAKEMSLQTTSGFQKITEFLYDKDILLLFDTFEYVLDGADLMSDLLSGTQKLTILVTSRNILNLRDEWVRVVEPLEIPDAIQEVSGAIALFEDRARRVIPDFAVEDHLPDVRHICQLVYGMPLAIEIATTWLKVLSCQEIAVEIQSSIDLLATTQRDVDERHRSIRAIFDQTWGLLIEEEQKVLARLSLFQGGFSLKTAEKIAGASIDMLSDFVDKSLIRRDPSGLYQFHELFQQYAESRLTQTVSGDFSTNTGMLVAWSSFVKGNFDHAEELLDDMSAGSVDSSSDLAKEAFGLALSGTIAGVNQNYNECEQMCAASLRVVSHLDSPDPITLIFSHLGLSIAACGLGNYANARQSILAALGVAQQLGTPAFTLVCLPNIAIIEAHEVNFENAVKIISFVYSDSAITPTWLRNWDLLAQLHASLETEMDHSLFQELWAQGKDLDVGLLMKETISHYN